MIAKVAVSNRIATGDGTVFVCSNSDYVIEFTFDQEWEEYDSKTARFITVHGYQDVNFTGNSCPVPALHNTRFMRVGVTAGGLRTTTAAIFKVRPCILCGKLQQVDSPELEPYEGDYSVTPAVEAQTLDTANKRMIDDLTIKAIPYYSVDNQQQGQTIIIGGD